MKKNEVRYGNKVLYGGSKTTIDEKEIIHFIRFPEKYEPILLTDEWLFKFGFIKKYSEFNLKGFNFIIMNNKVYTNDDYDNESICTLNFVHELQNLYFALTGEELTIK